MSKKNARIVWTIFILVVPLVAILYFGELTGQWVTGLVVGFCFGIFTIRLMQ